MFTDDEAIWRNFSPFSFLSWKLGWPFYYKHANVANAANAEWCQTAFFYVNASTSITVYLNASIGSTVYLNTSNGCTVHLNAGTFGIHPR